MRTRLFQCRIAHARFTPKRHRFAYRAFYLAVDLDELPEVARRFRLLSVDRPNVFSFRQRDFLPLDEPLHNPLDQSRVELPPSATLRERVDALLSSRGIHLGAGRVELVALPRMLGYLFNPVSFYFCRDAGGQPLAAIVEVTNTFREVKLYVLGPETWRDGAFRLRAAKGFYVSPFSDVDVAFDFVLPAPADRLAIRIDDRADGLVSFTSALSGRAAPLTDARLAWYLVAYPFLTARVIALIHWHAFRLAIKSTRWYRKSARGAEQRDLRRPHSSLVAPGIVVPSAVEASAFHALSSTS